MRCFQLRLRPGDVGWPCPSSHLLEGRTISRQLEEPSKVHIQWIQAERLFLLEPARHYMQTDKAAGLQL